MKLTYILLLSAIIGLAFAQTNSPEASKCRKATAAGKCELCPTAGDTAGGPRKLNATSNTCADVRSATTEQVAAAGATNVHHYGLMEGVGATMTYTQPTFAAAWGVTWYPNESTLFTCKDTYMAVYKSTLVTSLCVLANTIIDTSAAVLPWLPALATHSCHQMVVPLRDHLNSFQQARIVSIGLCLTMLLLHKTL